MVYVFSGYTALHRAASWGQTESLKELVASGADLQIRNVHGERAREAAARYIKNSCMEFLDKAGDIDYLFFVQVYSLCL